MYVYLPQLLSQNDTVSQLLCIKFTGIMGNISTEMGGGPKKK